MFRRTHYRDEHLAVLMERVLGTTIEELVPTVARWWDERLD